MKKHTLIAISRQFGSGGREVSKIVAEKLGVRRYDKKVVEMAADNIDGGMDPQEAVELSYNTPSNCMGNLGDYGYERVSRHNRMYIEQAKVILGVAKHESAVFLGRCADYILRDNPDCYSFFMRTMNSAKSVPRRITTVLRLRTSTRKRNAANSTMSSTRGRLGVLRSTTTS